MNRKIFALILTLLLIYIGGCGSEEEGKSKDVETITVQHELGETEVMKNPEKIVVFDFGALDTLDYLGIEVAGVAKTNIPSYLSHYEEDEYENIGSLKEPDFEKIAEIDPDLIIISGRQSDLYDQLEELGATIYLDIDTSRYLDSFKENSKILGEIFDREDDIAEALEEIEVQVEDVKNKAKESGKNGLILLANDDKISAYGENSRFGLIHDVFGIPAVDEGIEASTHGMNVSFEYVLEQDPDLLYVVDRSAAIGEEAAAKNIIENKLMEQTKAMQNDGITYLNPDIWYLSGGGIISIQEMIKEIAASLE